MNTLDATVIEINSEPVYKWVENVGWWGVERQTKAIAPTKEGLDHYKIGSVITV